MFQVGGLKAFQARWCSPNAAVPFSTKTNQDWLGVTIPERNSKTKGDATEAKVIYELASRGYDLSVPFGDNAKYDLVLDDEGNLYRIQCKTAWETKLGTIRFNTHSQTTKDGEYYESTYDGEIDAFVVWYPGDEQLYWIDIEDSNRRKMDLRFDAAIDHPSINWAEDYELGETIPR